MTTNKQDVELLIWSLIVLVVVLVIGGYQQSHRTQPPHITTCVTPVAADGSCYLPDGSLTYTP